MADGLHQLGVRAIAEDVYQPPSLPAILGGDAQLDQLVDVEGVLELRKQSVARTGVADAHYRTQVVGSGPQRAFLFS